jgi:dipeptidyl aminopeptidase/acylaminoacyl peptidase
VTAGRIFHVEAEMKSRKIPEPVYVTVRRRGLTMRGMIHLPAGASELRKVPMVLILHGFTGNRIGAGFSNVELSRRLAAAGIASIRMDFLGSGESDGRFEDMSVFTELADAEAILKFVKKQPFVDLRRIAVHGMSQGGLEAALLAGRHPADFACVSLWSPGFSIGDDWKKGIVKGFRLEDLRRDGYIDVGGFRVGEIYYDDAVAMQPYDTADQYPGPVQIVHGTEDKVVPIRFSRRLKKTLGSQCTLIEVEGAGHNYEKEAYSEARLNDAVDFLKRELLG